MIFFFLNFIFSWNNTITTRLELTQSIIIYEIYFLNCFSTTKAGGAIFVSNTNLVISIFSCFFNNCQSLSSVTVGLSSSVSGGGLVSNSKNNNFKFLCFRNCSGKNKIGALFSQTLSTNFQYLNYSSFLLCSSPHSGSVRKEASKTIDTNLNFSLSTSTYSIYGTANKPIINNVTFLQIHSSYSDLLLLCDSQNNAFFNSINIINNTVAVQTYSLVYGFSSTHYIINSIFLKNNKNTVGFYSSTIIFIGCFSHIPFTKNSGIIYNSGYSVISSELISLNNIQDGNPCRYLFLTNNHKNNNNALFFHILLFFIRK